jgi:tetratricopeptide (TPR) repeat protein
MFQFFIFLMALVALIPGSFAYALDSSNQLGTIEFPTSTSSRPAQKHFIRGVAALHSFWYTEALNAFEKSTIADPEFAMGYWGLAMTHNHPLWEDQDKKSAREALLKITEVSKLTQREQDYINAVRLLYGDEKKHIRDKAYSKAMKIIYQNYPEDVEAACFYSLSILGVARNTIDKLRLQVEAGAIALEVFQKISNHPCAAHYAIHAFDHPNLARLALPSAKRYAKIAPASHHAQHMSAHIFVQLGMWTDAVISNKNGWHTSVDWVEQKKLPRSERDYHSLQWLHYAYLQQGLLEEAATIFDIQQKDMLEGVQSQSNLRAGKYYYRMLAARVIETEQWESADKFDLPDGWKPKRFSIAGYNFVRGFASAMNGKIKEAKKYLSEIQAIRKKGLQENYFKRIEYLQVWELEIQTAIKLFQKDYKAANNFAKRAVKLEEKLPTPSGPPRILKPSYELLGEVYLNAGKPIQAYEKFSISLLRHPNRIRSLMGAARAADAKGDRKTAMENYQQVIRQFKNASSELSELNEARNFIIRK